MVIEVNDVQPLNIESVISSIPPSSNVTEAKSSQSVKTSVPIVVTEDGMVMLVRPEP